MIRFFFKPYPNFLGKKSFSKKIELSSTLEGLWHHAKIYINLMIQFQENIQMLGAKDGQNLFQRILPVTNRGLTSTVDWHLKVKDIEYNVGLTKIVA